MRSHSAPPIAYPSGRSRALGWGLLAAWLATALTVAAWLSQTALDERSFVTIGCLVLSGLALLHAWLRPAYGRLVWDGQAWCWEGAQAGRARTAPSTLESPEVLLDFQGALLLRLTTVNGGARRCVWLERASAQPRWLDLRRAVYARRSVVAASTATAQAAGTRPARV